MSFLCLQFLPKKRTKTRRIVVKTNSFVRFLEEFTAWQFAFEIIWPLLLKYDKIFDTTGFELLLKPNTKSEAANMKKMNRDLLFIAYSLSSRAWILMNNSIAISQDIF